MENNYKIDVENNHHKLIEILYSMIMLYVQYVSKDESAIYFTYRFTGLHSPTILILSHRAGFLGDCLVRTFVTLNLIKGKGKKLNDWK